MENSDYQDSGARIKVKYFSTKSSVKKAETSIEIPMDEIKPVVNKIGSFECRNHSFMKAKFTALFRFFLVYKDCDAIIKTDSCSWEWFAES